MPITTVPARTTITFRMIRPKLISDIQGWLQSACSATVQSQPVCIAAARAGICPGRAGQQHPRRYVWQCPAIWSAGCLRFVRPRIWLGRSRLRAADPACATCTAHLRPADVRTYGLRTIGADPYYQQSTQPQYTQSAYNQPSTYAQQAYYQAAQQQPGYGYAQKSKIVAGLLGLFLGSPRRAQLLSGIHRQGRGSAVADPDRMDHPYRTDHFRNLGSDRSRPHPVLQLRVQLAPRWARPRAPRLMGRGLYKQPGGKLVGVAVRLSDAVPAYSRECASSAQSVEQCRIDGDFFLDGDDKDSRRLLQDLENLLQSQQKRARTRHYATIASDYRELSERAIGGYDGRRYCHRFPPRNHRQ